MSKVIKFLCLLIVLLVCVVWYAYYTVPLTSQELMVLTTDYLAAYNNHSSFDSDVFLFPFEKEAVVVSDFTDAFNYDVIEWEKALLLTENTFIDLQETDLSKYPISEEIEGTYFISTKHLSSFPVSIIDGRYGLLYTFKDFKQNPFDSVVISDGSYDFFANKYVVPFFTEGEIVKGEVSIYLNSFKRIKKIEITY